MALQFLIDDKPLGYRCLIDFIGMIDMYEVCVKTVAMSWLGDCDGI